MTRPPVSLIKVQAELGTTGSRLNKEAWAPFQVRFEFKCSVSVGRGGSFPGEVCREQMR